MASTAAAGTPAANASEAELMIGGMTCASCAARVEKKLNRMDGVTATVNYATEKARVTFAEGLELSDLVATVEKTGYTARPTAPPKRPAAPPQPEQQEQQETEPGPRPEPDPQAPQKERTPERAEAKAKAEELAEAEEQSMERAQEPASADVPAREAEAEQAAAAETAEAEQAAALAALRQRFIVSAVLSVPVILLAMVPALQFDSWQWLSLTLAAPVVVWGGLPFHRATWTNLRHGAATMDTLVSMGTLAAFGWSLWALFLGDAGMPGMRHGFDLTVSRADASSTIYLEVAAGVITFILLGRYLEARAKRKAGAALRALLHLGAKDVAVLRDDGTEVRVPADRLAVGDRFVVRPGEKIATDGTVVEGTSAVDASMLT
ncbi:cation transporter, partial [Streptomyces bacillaris]